MQLFITKEFTILNKTLEITDPRVIYQCTKVLRYRKGDRITLQHEKSRYTCALIEINKNSLTTNIESIIHRPEQQSTHSSLVVAMVNKWDKLELIVQKCAELGVHEVGIRKSKRSVISIFSENKIQRLRMIMLEAAEQSRNRTIPSIKIYNAIDELDSRSYVAYQFADSSIQTPTKILPGQEKKSIIIGPEGGFDPKEILYFQENHFLFFSLGTTILRTETAAILSAWICTQ